MIGKSRRARETAANGHQPSRSRIMVTVMLMSVVLIAGLCVLAYTLAVYALPFMLGLTACAVCLSDRLRPDWGGACRPCRRWRGVRHSGAAVRLAALPDPAPDRGADLRRARRRRRICACPRRQQGIRAVRNLAANLLHYRRRLRRHIGLDAAGSARSACLAAGSGRQ